MSTVTDILRECHRLRKHLRALQEEIDRGPRVLKAEQNRLASEQIAHKDHHDNITKLKLKQREDEGTLKQTETRLAKLEDQLSKITVQKEFEAKQSEIRQAQEKKTALEDAILATMTELEEKVAAVPGVDKQWADTQAEFAQFQVDAAERLERLRADQVQAQAELAKIEVEIPEKVRPIYNTWVKAHGPDAMAAVKGRVCQACRSSMTEQKAYDLMNGTFAQCSNCGKLLYPTTE